MSGIGAGPVGRAPDPEAFERIAAGCLAALPEAFRTLCAGVVIRIAEFADDETLDEMEIDSPWDLLGLFRGAGLAHDGFAPATGQLPNEIWLYRRPIIAYWREGDDTLEAVINHVLVHEIGHHFGLSDDDMYAIDDAEDD